MRPRAVTYVTNNWSRRAYPRYRRLGLPISSAPVASAIKQLNQGIKERENFWLLGGAEPWLQVRAAYLSKDDCAKRYWARPWKGSPRRSWTRPRNPAGPGSGRRPERRGARSGPVRRGNGNDRGGSCAPVSP
jgi:hypothetical protein